MTQIVFVVSNKNNFFINTPFYEYVNLLSDTMYCYVLNEYDVKFNPDIVELINHNKPYMTFGVPDNNYNPSCPNSTAARTLGIQCVGMRYNITDTTMLIINEEFFDTNGHAFVLKPDSLRYFPDVHPDPIALAPELNLGSRDISFPMGVSSQI
jgi:hypothetical protein